MPIVLLNTATERQYQLLVETVVDKVRHVVQDETAPYRYTDAELIGWLNDAVNTILGVNPALFFRVRQHTCFSGYKQTIANARATALIDIIGVPVADIASLTAFAPGWQGAATGAIKNWLRIAGEPLGFYVYPPSAEGQSFPVVVVESPEPLNTLADYVPLPESLEPALVDYCVYMAQAKDDEAVDTNRTQQFLASFASRVKGS